MVCTISPCKAHAVESLSTLKFGRRCKMVVTKARKGTVLDDKALIEKYRKEVERLKEKLENGPTHNVNSNSSDDVDDDIEKKTKMENLDKHKEEVEEMLNKKMELRNQIQHLTRLIVTSHSLSEDRKKSRQSLGGEEIDDPNSILNTPNGSGRRGPRMSDLSSISKITGKSIFSNQLSSLNESFSTSSPIPKFNETKPFALESELSSLRKDLSNALESRQLSEKLRREENEEWSERFKELENEIKESEEELDLAQVSFQKLKKERDESNERVEDYQNRIRQYEEDVRLLKLVKQSRDKREGNDEVEIENIKKGLKEEFEKKKLELEESWKIEKEALQEKLEKESDQVVKLRDQIKNQKNDIDFETRNEFNDLVKGNEDSDHQAELEKIKKELNAKTEELEAKEKELTTLKSSQRPLPVPSRQNSNNGSITLSNLKPSNTSDESEVRTLERRLAEKEEKNSKLEKELKEALSKLNSSREEDSNNKSSLPRSETLASKMETMVELQMTIDEQNLKITSLEKELKEEKSKRKPLPIPNSSGTPHSPASPSKLRNSSIWSSTDSSSFGDSNLTSPSKDRTNASLSGIGSSRFSLGTSTGLNRGGSLREYKKYDPTSEDVFSRTSIPKSRRSIFGGASSEKDEATNFSISSSLPTSSSSRYSLDLASSPFLSTSRSRNGFVSESVIEEAVRIEREEISRLNSVIQSQRSLMADLEQSVKGWKNRLKIQQELIERLANGEAGSSSNSLIGSNAGLGVSLPSNVDKYTSSRSKNRKSSSGYKKEKEVKILLPESTGDRSLEDIDINNSSSRRDENVTSSYLKNKTSTPSLRTRGSSTLPTSSYDKFNSLPSIRGSNPISKSSAPPSTTSTTSSSSPYYGAHTFNRIPGSPTKSNTSSIFSHHAFNSSYSPSLSNPDPLPLPTTTSNNVNYNTSYEVYDYHSPKLQRKQSNVSLLESRNGSGLGLNVPSSPSQHQKRKPRKTIENEMEMLRNRDGYGLKDVRSTREKLLDSPNGKKSSRGFDGLEIDGGKRSKDWYI